MNVYHGVRKLYGDTCDDDEETSVDKTITHGVRNEIRQASGLTAC